MLSEQELAALAADLESFHVEYKESLRSGKAAVEEAICAFANDLPGTGRPGFILIGVDDRTRQPTGLAVTDQLLLELANIRSDGNILPFPTMVVYKAALAGRDIVVIEVHPSHDPPVRLRGRVCIRVGPRKGTATRDEERILTERRRGWDGPFDQRAVRGASLDDLDLNLFQREFVPSAVTPEVLRENGRSIPEQLAALHLASPDGIPNVAGMLVLGRDPTTYLPGAYVQFLRVDGTELTDPIVDRKELSGPLPEVLRRELHNPGGLYGRATPQTFGRPGGNDYRNPTVAMALYMLGFVQPFGMGIPLAKKACRDNGNPEPEFLFEPSTFAVIVRARP